MPKALDIHIDDRFGDLQVVGFLPSKRGHRYIKVRCRCGQVKESRLDGLTGGTVVSCGCAKIRRCTTHGLTQTPEFRIEKKYVN